MLFYASFHTGIIWWITISYHRLQNNISYTLEHSILTNKNILANKIWFILILSTLFYSAIIFFSDINNIFSHVAQIDFKIYLIIFPLAFLYLLVASWRYGQLLKKIGIVLGFRDYFLLYVAGESMAITPGGLGSVVKSHILEKTTGKSFSSTAPIVLFERWIDLGGILLALGILSVLMNMRIFQHTGLFLDI